MRFATIMIKQEDEEDHPSYIATVYERGVIVVTREIPDVVEAVSFARDSDVGIDRVHVFSLTGYPVPLCDLPGVRSKFVARIC